MPVDEEFRERLRALLARTGLSQRQASLAFARDIGYVQSLLDITRPGRAQPTPADLIAFSDATAIPFVELLEQLWDVPPERLARELVDLGQASVYGDALADLSAAERQSVADYLAFLRARRHSTRGRGTKRPDAAP